MFCNWRQTTIGEENVASPRDTLSRSLMLLLLQLLSISKGLK